MKNKRRQKVINAKNEIKTITKDSADIRGVREYCKQLYTHKFDIVDEMDQFTKKHKLLNSPNM